MGLGTLFSGDVKCAWCGGYIKNTDGGLTGALGLDIVKRAGAAAIPHYCSKACKVAAEQAKEARSSSETDAAGATVVVQKTSLWNALTPSQSDAEVQAEREKEIEVQAKIDEGHQAVAAVAFGDDAVSVVNTLTELLMIINKYDPKTVYYQQDQDALKSVRKSAFDKMEMGIMLLRSKGDAVQADYFQTKMQEKKEEGTLTALGKKFGFGNKGTGIKGTQEDPLDAMKQGFGKLGGLFGKNKQNDPANAAPAAFCSSCGASLSAGSKFCPSCGKVVGQA